MRLFNALTGRLERFEPIRPGEVRMYVCGPTVSDDAHLGHGRAAAVFDLLRRFFRFRGYRVVYVRNVTDVDDKIVERARRERTAPEKLAEHFLARHDEDMERLRVPAPEIAPRASQHIEEMIEHIRKLIEKGAAYEKDGDVFFRLAAAPDFGRLARAYGKEPERDDFLLWKKASWQHEPAWDSPWGRGRPGWHIECTAMSGALLGFPFDIHGGGVDLAHPHHDAEIAQATAATDEVPARFFLHNGLVLLAEEKMSKSTGRFFTLREIFARYDPAVVRYYLFRHHYRAPIEFRPEDLEPARRAVERIEAFLAEAARVVGPSPTPPCPSCEALKEAMAYARREVVEALEDDLDTPRALDALEHVIEAGEEHLKSQRPDPALLGKVEELFDAFDEIFDIRPERASAGSRTGALLETILAVRRRLLEAGRDDAASRRAADEIGAALTALGIEIRDTPWGTRWRWE